ncbi:MAG: T9SS type A sorting domain-containing protein [Bacteroidota bacterium]
MKYSARCLRTFLIIFFFLTGVLISYGQKINSNYSTNGYNYTAIEKNGLLFVGGEFTEVGKSSLGTACLDLLNGKLLYNKTFKSDDFISTVIEDEIGGFYIGGSFRFLNDTSVMALAHINNDGTLDSDFKFKFSTQYSPIGSIKSLYKMGDTLFVVGYFDSINGGYCKNVTGVNLKTKKILDWKPNIGGSVQSIIYNKDYVFIGGAFSTYNNFKVLNFVKLRRSDFGYTYSLGFNGTVSKLILDSTRVVAKGVYSSSGWQNVGLIMADTTDIERAVLGCYLNGYANEIVVDPKGGWFVAGKFTIDGQPNIVNLMRLKSDYSVDTLFKYKFPYEINEIEVVDSFLFCASANAFTLNGKSFDKMAIINHYTKKLLDYNFKSQANIRSFYAYKDQLIVKTINELFRFKVPSFEMLDAPVGDIDVEVDSIFLYLNSGLGYISMGNVNITQVNDLGQSSKVRAKQYLTECNDMISDGNGGWFAVGNGIRHILSDGTLDGNLSMEFQMGVAECVLKYGDTLFVGGTFHNIKKLGDPYYTVKSNFVILNIKTGSIGAFSCDINKQSPNYLNNGNVKQLTIVGDSLLMAGVINVVGTSTYRYYNNLAKLSLKSYSYSSVAPNFDYIIDRSYQADSFVYLGGAFRKVEGARFPGICRFNKFSMKLSSWKPAIDTNSMVYNITSDNSFIYVVSRIVAPITYKATHYFKRIRKSNGAVVPFGSDMDSTFSSAAYFPISAVKIQDDTIYIFGQFDKMVYGTTYTNVLKFNKITGQIYPFTPIFAGQVRYIEPLSNGHILLGGAINDLERQNNVLIGRYNLEKNTLDNWKIKNHTSAYPPPGKVVFSVNKQHIYFAKSNYNNTTFEGISRNIIFKAVKQSGAITKFNAKIPYNTPIVEGVKCIGRQVYLLSKGILYKMLDGKDSITQMIQVSSGVSNRGLKKGMGDRPFISGDILIYNSNSNALSFDGYTNKMVKGMNGFLGTFNPNSTASSVFYNYRDSIYYMFESLNKNDVNKLGASGNYYRVNPTTKEVKKLDFVVLGVKGICRKDSNLIVYGQFNTITSKSITKPMVNIFKFNEAKSEVDFKWLVKPNNIINNVLITQKNDCFIMGDFTLVNRELRRNICAIDVKADTITAYSPDPTARVKKIVDYDTGIILTGDFTTTRFGSAVNMAYLDVRSGRTIYNFNASNATFNDIIINNNKLYFGGYFTNYKSSGINNLGRYDLKTKLIDSWDPKITGTVTTLNTDDSFIYAVGTISKVNTTNQLYYAKLRKDNAVNMPILFQLKWPTGMQSNEGRVLDMCLTENLIYLCGIFELDTKRRGIIAINRKSGLPTNYKVDFLSFNPGSFSSMARYNDKVLTNTSVKLNGVNGGNVAVLDRFQSITYPSLPNTKAIKGSSFVITQSKKSIFFLGSLDAGNFFVNNSRTGNIIVFDKDSNNSEENIADFSPSKAGNIGKATVKITGSLLSSDNLVYLVRNGDTIRCKQMEAVDGNMMFATFNFNNDSIGDYLLHVEFNNSNTSVFAKPFELINSIGPSIKTSIMGYPAIRASRWYDYVLKIENTSANDMANVPIYFALQNNGQLQVEALNSVIDTFAYSRIDTFRYKADKNYLYAFLIPTLKTQDVYSIPVRLKVVKGDSIALSVWHQLPLGEKPKAVCLQQVWKKFSGLTVAENCISKTLMKMDTSIRSNINYEFGDASTVIDYNRFYRSTVVGCGSSFSVSNLAKINSYYANPGFVSEIDSACIYSSDENNSDSAVIVLNDPNKLMVKVVNSLDPNDKIGPLGNTSNNLMTALPSLFNYVIRFENDSSASAPAQIVIVKDTIDKRYFDISSVKFTSFKVGDYKYYFLPNTTGINKYFDFRSKANVVLNLNASIDTGKGIITWVFNSLDIATLTSEKLNPIYGFLPPNDKTNKGQGSVSFEIKLKEGVNGFADIKNRADIVFDENKSILTKYWRVVKDGEAPESKVLPLAKSLNVLSFPVAWQAIDSLGVKKIDVFYSSNKIVYQLWETSYSDSSALFSGINDSTYYFYSIATDIAGNQENKPDSFDAMTHLHITIVNSLNRITSDNLYTIYPNPSTGLVNIKSNDGRLLNVSIYSLDGKLIATMESANGEMKFVVAQKGLYLMEIKSDNTLLGVEKIIVE